jgi:hypothetical protein
MEAQMKRRYRTVAILVQGTRKSYGTLSAYGGDLVEKGGIRMKKRERESLRM